MYITRSMVYYKLFTISMALFDFIKNHSIQSISMFPCARFVYSFNTKHGFRIFRGFKRAPFDLITCDIITIIVIYFTYTCDSRTWTITRVNGINVSIPQYYNIKLNGRFFFIYLFLKFDSSTVSNTDCCTTQSPCLNVNQNVFNLENKK